MENIRAWTFQLAEDYLQILFAYKIKLKKPVFEIRPLGNRWGQWDPETRTMTFSERLIETHPWNIVLEILKHEMAHQYVTDIFGSDESHGPLFKQACDKLGVAFWARKAESELEALIKLGELENNEEESRLLNRVEKLLALATSTNEHEALAAMQKVQQLYVKYNLERVEKNQNVQYLSKIIFTHKKRLERYQYVICSILNEHFFVEVIHSSLYDAKKLSEFKVIEILGTRENVQMAEYVYHFLMNQIEILWKGYQKERHKNPRARRSFSLGVATGFRDKLERHSLELDKKESSKALVARQDKELEVFVRSRYPRLVKIQHGARVHEAIHYNAGKNRGASLVLHRGVSSATGMLGKLIRSKN
ncbi:MAG: SprT-like domain-containing protein [Deltaproteobacteria bacterium]